MANEPGNEKLPFLGGFASILSLLGITLFFSGWIYRWAYFAYFNLDVNAQSYPAQSFLIVPIQIFVGSVANFFKTLIVLSALPLLIVGTLWLLHRLPALLALAIRRLPWIRSLRPLARQASGPQPAVRRFGASLLDELVVVGWVLVLLFWLSQHQGQVDARRDALESSSTLPVVTLVLPQAEGVLGQDLRYLDDSTEAIPDPPLANNVFIGDRVLARQIRDSSLSDPESQHVWRLLANETLGWLYLIRTLPDTSEPSERPLVLAIPNAKQGQSLILSPATPEISP
jgi:hypothetical protein